MDIIKFDVYRGPNLGVYVSVNNSSFTGPNGIAESKLTKNCRLSGY